MSPWTHSIWIHKRAHIWRTKFNLKVCMDPIQWKQTTRTVRVRNRQFSIFWSTMPYSAYIEPSKRFNRIVSIFLTINLRFAFERKFHFIKCFANISRTFWVRNRYFSTFWSTLPYIVCMQSSKRFNIIVSIFLATNLRFFIERKFHFIKYFAYISQEIFTRNSH